VDLVQDLQRRFDDHDFIVSPVAAGPAFLHNQKHVQIELEGRTLGYLDYAMPFVLIYNACGNPALVVPAGKSRNGLPIGIQIAAPHYAEAELIHFGKLIEQLGVACTKPLGY
jgi:amidase